MTEIQRDWVECLDALSRAQTSFRDLKELALNLEVRLRDFWFRLYPPPRCFDDDVPFPFVVNDELLERAGFSPAEWHANDLTDLFPRSR